MVDLRKIMDLEIKSNADDTTFLGIKLNKNGKYSANINLKLDKLQIKSAYMHIYKDIDTDRQIDLQ